MYNGKNAFQQGMKVVDCGDVALTVLVSMKSTEREKDAEMSVVQDNTIALKQLDSAHKVRTAHNSTISQPTNC